MHIHTSVTSLENAHGFKLRRGVAWVGPETASETVDNAARGGARDLCVELGGSCDYTGRLGVDY